MNKNITAKESYPVYADGNHPRWIFILCMQDKQQYKKVNFKTTVVLTNLLDISWSGHKGDMLYNILWAYWASWIPIIVISFKMTFDVIVSDIHVIVLQA